MPWLIFFSLASLWGFSFIAIKYVIVVFPPVLGVACRVVLSLITLAVIYLILKKPIHIPRSVMWRSWCCGLLYQAIPFCLLFWGEQYVSPGLASIMNGTVPLWTFGLALLFLKKYETFTFQKFLGLTLGFIGILIIFYPKLTAQGSANELWGFLALLGMALCYSGGNILNRYIIAKYTQVSITSNLFHQTVASVAVMLPLSLIIDGPSQWALLPTYFQSSSATLGLIYLAVVASSLAWIFYFYLMKEWDALRASALAYLIPLVTLVADFFIFHTAAPFTDILGMGIVFGGVALVQYKKRRTPQYVTSNVTGTNP